VEKVEEEIRTLVLNYEEQLSVMSDLLADMNGRLAAQGDTIHQLRSPEIPAFKRSGVFENQCCDQ
jgi:hypothetical protein